jgi:hypothetical protein
MLSWSWFVAGWVWLFVPPPVALSEQINSVAEKRQSADCSDNGDRRHMDTAA